MIFQFFFKVDLIFKDFSKKPFKFKFFQACANPVATESFFLQTTCEIVKCLSSFHYVALKSNEQNNERLQTGRKSLHIGSASNLPDCIIELDKSIKNKTCSVSSN